MLPAGPQTRARITKRYAAMLSKWVGPQDDQVTRCMQLIKMISVGNSASPEELHARESRRLRLIFEQYILVGIFLTAGT